MKNIHMLVTIARREDSEEFIQFFAHHSVQTIYATVAEGTTRPGTLSRLGLEATGKSVLFAIVPGNKTENLFKRMSTELRIDLPDRGIAVAVPLSSVGGAKAYRYFLNGTDEKDVEGEPMQSNYELIIAITQAGCTEMVMNAARAGGAGGGTVVHAKGTAAAGTEKFFGVSLADEKELVFIVATLDKKKDIMKSIMDNAGVNTEAHALVFSMPVAATAGFKLFDVDEE